MSDLTINIQLPDNTIIENALIPDDYLTEEVISELVDLLNLPRMTEHGQPVEYGLFSLSDRATLPPHKRLISSGVQNGDTLRLVSSHELDTEEDFDTEDPNSDGAEKSDDRFIDVILSVLDISKSELIRLTYDQEIGLLIFQVISTYNLPVVDKFYEPITYHLISKALGCRLDRAKTLRQEEIPAFDKLILTRESLAGGGHLQCKVEIEPLDLTLLELIPRDYKIQQIIDSLLVRLRLPRVSPQGPALKYALQNVTSGKTFCNQGLLLEDMRVGDTLRLVSDRSLSEHGRSLAGPVSPSVESEPVNCTVFAPPTVRQGDSCLVQIFAHLLDQADATRAAAKEFDEDTERRGSQSLGINVERGSTLTFHLFAPDLEVEEPVQNLVWRGSPESVQFRLSVPRDQWLGDFIATVRVCYDQVPVGHIKFKIEVVGAEQATKDNELTGEAQVYRKAFVSYAAQDRVEVLKRVQVLIRLRIKVFQDILNLEPGERWEQALYRFIDDSDIFLLFWSTAAKNSQWVIREVRYALWLKKGDEFAPPEIIPVILEGPPIVPPPDELAHLHFNDQLLYLISGSKLSALPTE